MVGEEAQPAGLDAVGQVGQHPDRDVELAQDVVLLGLQPDAVHVVGTLREERLLLDVRCVPAEQEDALVASVQRARDAAAPS